MTGTMSNTALEGTVLSDGSAVRLRDSTGTSPTFSSGGSIEGRLEVLPSGQTEWGSCNSAGWESGGCPQVTCQEIANEFGYKLESYGHLTASETPDGSGRIWWEFNVGCALNLETLEACNLQVTSSTDHTADIGVRCTFSVAEECEVCPAGKYSDSIGPDACTSCPGGTYGPSEEASSCQACAAGKANANGAGQTMEELACSDCNTGEYSSAGDESCTMCSAGKYSALTGTADACLDCPVGTSTVGQTG